MWKVRAATVQFEHLPDNKAANLATIRSFTENASRQGVDIVVFPECCITGYWHLRHKSREELMDLSEEIPAGPSVHYLLELSRDCRLTLGAGLVERHNGVLFNAYVVVQPDGSWFVHRKLHAFVSPHIHSGSGFTVFDLPYGVRAGVLTCYDVNILENVRVNALRGVEILIAPHQTGGCTSPDPDTMGRIDRNLWENRQNDPGAIEAEFRGTKGRAWLMRWLPSRAHDNGLFILFSNGVGVDDDEIRTGNSMILDPYGRILSETGKAGDDLVQADLDGSLVEKSLGRRWLRARRPLLYSELTQITGLEEETRSVRFDGKGV